MKNSESTTQDTPKKALLISVYTGTANKQICDEHLEELALLTETYGAEIVQKIPCQVRQFNAATYISTGKLEELVKLSKECEANLIIFDDEISASQQRVLEKEFGMTVMDRTGVILDVFAQRAQTKEARLQIELAQVKYQAPRLKKLWTHLSRQQGSGGGGMYLKGEGEKQIEIDRRLLKNRIEQLQDEINEVKAVREQQRAARIRSEIPVFAIIGYTNAGKSTLLNALTGAGVFVEDKLFATLDTTTRKFSLPNKQDVLLIDTVGFIRKLPHLLVAAFKSTLEEAIQADILLHLVDVSHPMAEEQAQTTFEVLKELNAKNTPIITVLNKKDIPGTEQMIQRMKFKYPHTVAISAKTHEGFDTLIQKMIEELSKQRKIVDLRIPQSQYKIVSDMIRVGHVINQDFEENDVLMKVEIPSSMVAKVKNFIVE